MENLGYKQVGTGVSSSDISDANPGTAIIIVGTGRSGTSLIANILHELGINIGSIQRPPFEDKELREALQKRNWKHLKKIVRGREEKFSLFAWKDPSYTWCLGRIHRIFRRPKYIFIYRDILATGLRADMSERNPFGRFGSKYGVLIANALMVRFSSKKGINAMHISYEKLLSNQFEITKAIAKFCGISLTSQDIQLVIERTQSNKAKYMDWFERNASYGRLQTLGYEGHLDKVTKHKLFGWLRKENSDQPVKVSLRINGMPKYALICNNFRKDLKEIGKGSGFCGFSIDLSDFWVDKGYRIELLEVDSNQLLIAVQLN